MVAGLFTGLSAAVAVIVAQAVVRVVRRALTHPLLVGMAVAAFVALAVFGVAFPIVIAAVALIGWWTVRRVPALIQTSTDATDGTAGGPAPLIADDALHHEAPSARRPLHALVVGLAAWSTPVALVALLTGTGSVFTNQGRVFASTALVTFGGAYAVPRSWHNRRCRTSAGSPPAGWRAAR